MNCQTCKYSKLVLGQEGAGKFICTRYPPNGTASIVMKAGTMHPVFVTAWPNVSPADSCGEYAPALVS